jgi:hypothetical protein
MPCAMAGVLRESRATLLPMRGRLIHDLEGGTSLQPYGQRPNELIYSISRHRLNQTCSLVAARQPGDRSFRTSFRVRRLRARHARRYAICGMTA